MNRLSGLPTLRINSGETLSMESFLDYHFYEAYTSRDLNVSAPQFLMPCLEWIALPLKVRDLIIHKFGTLSEADLIRLHRPAPSDLSGTSGTAYHACDGAWYDNRAHATDCHDVPLWPSFAQVEKARAYREHVAKFLRARKLLSLAVPTDITLQTIGDAIENCVQEMVAIDAYVSWFAGFPATLSRRALFTFHEYVSRHITNIQTLLLWLQRRFVFQAWLTRARCAKWDAHGRCMDLLILSWTWHFLRIARLWRSIRHSFPEMSYDDLQRLRFNILLKSPTFASLKTTGFFDEMFDDLFYSNPTPPTETLAPMNKAPFEYYVWKDAAPRFVCPNWGIHFTKRIKAMPAIPSILFPTRREAKAVLHESLVSPFVEPPIPEPSTGEPPIYSNTMGEITRVSPAPRRISQLDSVFENSETRPTVNIDPMVRDSYVSPTPPPNETLEDRYTPKRVGRVRVRPLACKPGIRRLPREKDRVESPSPSLDSQCSAASSVPDAFDLSLDEDLDVPSLPVPSTQPPTSPPVSLPPPYFYFGIALPRRVFRERDIDRDGWLKLQRSLRFGKHATMRLNNKLYFCTPIWKIISRCI